MGWGKKGRVSPRQRTRYKTEQGHILAADLVVNYLHPAPCTVSLYDIGTPSLTSRRRPNRWRPSSGRGRSEA